MPVAPAQPPHPSRPLLPDTGLGVSLWTLLGVGGLSLVIGIAALRIRRRGRV